MTKREKFLSHFSVDELETLYITPPGKAPTTTYSLIQIIEEWGLYGYEDIRGFRAWLSEFKKVDNND
jgi:hypothetical protein